MAVAHVRNVGTGQNKTSSTTVACSAIATSAVASGNTLYLFTSADNLSSTTPTVSSISKMSGESASWVKLVGHGSSVATAAGGVVGELWAITTTRAWTVGTVVTVTWSGAITAKTVIIDEFSGATVTLRSTVGSGTSTTGVPTASTSGTALVSGDLVLGGSSLEYNTVPATDSDTLNGTWDAGTTALTTGSTAATNVSSRFQWKIVNAVGAQTFNITGTSTDSGCVIASTQSSTIFSVTASPDGIATVEAFGTAIKTAGTLTASPTGISSNTVSSVRTNGATNPRAISGNGGWSNNDPATYALSLVSSGVPTHPLGITTAAKGNVITSGVSALAITMYNVDNLGASATSRQLGMWVYPEQAGYEVASSTGFTDTPLTAGVWTYVQASSYFTGYSNFQVAKVTGNAVSTDIVWVTGCMCETAVVGSYFDGDTTDTGTDVYAWTGTAGASTSTDTYTAVSGADIFGISTVIYGSISVSPTAISTIEAFGTPTYTASGAPPITVSPTGIATAEIFGTPVYFGTCTASPTGIASVEAFGFHTNTAGVITASPTGIASLEAFGTDSITYGALTASPIGINSLETFGTAIQTNLLTASPNGVTTAEAFGTVVQTNLLTSAPTGIASAEVFGTTINTTTLTSSPRSIASAEACGTLTVQPFVYNPGAIGSVTDNVDGTAFSDSAYLTDNSDGTVTLSLYDTDNSDGTADTDIPAEVFGTATVTVAAPILTVSPTGISTAETFGTPVYSGTTTGSPTSITTAETFGTAVNTPGAITASPTAISTLEAFGTPVPTMGVISASPTSISTGEAFGTAVCTAIMTASPGGVSSGETFGITVHVGLLTVVPTGISTQEALGAPIISAGASPVTASPTGIASTEVFGTPVFLGLRTMQPTGIASVETFGTTGAIKNLVARPTGIASVETFGTPVDITGPVTYSPTGISTAGAVGVPTYTSVLTASPIGIASGETFGTTANNSTLVATPTSVTLLAVFGTPVVTLGEITALSTGIISAEVFGTVIIHHGMLTISPDGIDTLESFGSPYIPNDRQFSGWGMPLSTR